LSKRGLGLGPGLGLGQNQLAPALLAPRPKPRPRPRPKPVVPQPSDGPRALELYLAGIEPMLLQPAWLGVDDPVERVFALLAAYRGALVSTHETYGCPIGSLALELHEPDEPVRKLLAANFNAWVSAIEACFDDETSRIPRSVDRRALAILALTTMEGGVMLARTERRIDAFDASVGMFRDYVDRQRTTASSPRRSRSR